MTKAIRVYETGGPEVMRWEEFDTPKPGQGQVLIHHEAIGLNYIDIYYRTGLYKAPSLPFIPGLEGCGTVLAVGPGTSVFKIGDRVAYAMGPMGAYATERVIDEKFLVKVPDGIQNAIAAAVMLKGLTAHYLLKRTFTVRGGVTILVHAAAGGVGLMLTQWARHLGATIIGTVGSDEKAALAHENGCHFVINYRNENVPERVRFLTGGKGVNVVYDAVGKDTFMDSLDSLTRFGLMVSYGQSSGAIPPFDISLLSQKGSLFLTRPTLMHYKEDQAEYIIAAAEMFELILKGVIKVNVGQSYYLQDAARAHRDLEARKTTGASVLLPG